MPDVQEVFRSATQEVRPDSGFVDRQHDHRRRQERKRKVGALALVVALGAAAAVVVIHSSDNQGESQPAGTGPSVTTSGAGEVDYVIDLNTGVMTPLPEAIIRSLGETDVGKSEWQYAASPDGSQLAYVGTGDDGSLQIFIAGIDGSGSRQVTHDPRSATSPAWSPDGTTIAYVGYGGGEYRNLFVLEVATDATRLVTAGFDDLSGPSFTPDGSSLVYTDPSSVEGDEMRTVPIAGGPSTILFGGGRRGMGNASAGSISPDGSHVTMTGEESYGPGAQVFVSNADGTQRRAIPAYGTTPAGTWSPDGRRIVCRGYSEHSIKVVDIATGDVSRVAEGSAAIWLDDHTLLVEA